jgi:hypothetical protein
MEVTTKYKSHVGVMLTSKSLLQDKNTQDVQLVLGKLKQG